MDSRMWNFLTIRIFLLLIIFFLSACKQYIKNHETEDYVVENKDINSVIDYPKKISEEVPLDKSILNDVNEMIYSFDPSIKLDTLKILYSNEIFENYGYHIIYDVNKSILDIGHATGSEIEDILLSIEDIIFFHINKYLDPKIYKYSIQPSIDGKAYKEYFNSLSSRINLSYS